jgi:hypothetical protein
MPDFDRAEVEEYIAYARRPAGSYLEEEQGRKLAACLAEIDRRETMVVQMKAMHDEIVEELVRQQRQAEQRGYRRGLEDAASMIDSDALEAEGVWNYAHAHGARELAARIRALMDTPTDAPDEVRTCGGEEDVHES